MSKQCITLRNVIAEVVRGTVRSRPDHYFEVAAKGALHISLEGLSRQDLFDLEHLGNTKFHYDNRPAPTLAELLKPVSAVAEVAGELLEEEEEDDDDLPPAASEDESKGEGAETPAAPTEGGEVVTDADKAVDALAAAKLADEAPTSEPKGDAEDGAQPPTSPAPVEAGGEPAAAPEQVTGGTGPDPVDPANAADADKPADAAETTPPVVEGGEQAAPVVEGGDKPADTAEPAAQDAPAAEPAGGKSGRRK